MPYIEKLENGVVTARYYTTKRKPNNRNLKISKGYTDRKCKKITALAIINAVITAAFILIVCKWRQVEKLI